MNCARYPMISTREAFPTPGIFLIPLGHEQKAFWCVDSKVGESIDGPIGQSAAVEHASLRFAAFEHVSFRFLTRDCGGRAHAPSCETEGQQPLNAI